MIEIRTVGDKVDREDAQIAHLNRVVDEVNAMFGAPQSSPLPPTGDLDLNSYVYFLQLLSHGRQIKIGLSGDPWRRGGDLQTANPHPIALIGVVRGGAPLEQALHRALDADRIVVRGSFAGAREWFRPTRRVVGAIHAALSEERLWAGAGPLDVFLRRVALESR